MTTAVKEKEAVDLDDVLGSAESNDTSKNKSSVKTLNVDEDIKQLAGRCRAFSLQMKSAETSLTEAQAELTEHIEPLRIAELNGGFISTVRIPTADGYSVDLSWKDAYKVIPLTKKAELETLVGEENYPHLFETVIKITVSDVSESALTDLISLVGKRFKDFFTVKRHISPTQRFTETSHRLDNREEIIEIVKQYKPSLKAR